MQTQRVGPASLAGGHGTAAPATSAATQMKQAVRGHDFAAQTQMLAADRVEGATSGPPEARHAALMRHIANPVVRAQLVAGLGAGDKAVIADFKARTAEIRPLPAAVNTLLDEAWQVAFAQGEGGRVALCALVQLRFGTYFSCDRPVAEIAEVWRALGKVPGHLVESPDPKRNTPTDGGVLPNQDPLIDIRIGGSGKGGGASNREIELGLGDLGVRNRFPVDTELRSSDGKHTKANTSTLPADLGPEKDPSGLRRAFNEAGATELSHSLLHELGHTLDRERGIMNKGLCNFPRWSERDAQAGEAFASAMGLADVPGMAEAIQAKCSGPLVEAEATKLGVTPQRLKAARATEAGKWLIAHEGFGGPRMFERGMPADLGGRAYYCDAGGGASWTSYDLAYRKTTAVSDYQWKNKREWFAESYAVYYDSALPGELLRRRDPKMTGFLDAMHMQPPKS